jgi:hypothetical protein
MLLSSLLTAGVLQVMAAVAVDTKIQAAVAVPMFLLERIPVRVFHLPHLQILFGTWSLRTLEVVLVLVVVEEGILYLQLIKMN